MPIVESRESKTRSEEGILPSFRISKHKSLKTQNISPDFLWLGRQTRHLHLSSSFRPLPRALLMCFHVICPVLRASAVSSVHTRRCSHQCSPPTTLAEDLAPISGSKQPARVLRGLEAPSRCWRSGVPRATMFNLHKVAPPLNETSLLLLGSSTYSRPPQST